MSYEMTKMHADDFPSSLLELPQPPKELYIVGKLPPQSYVYLTIVGSRKYTSYGKDTCEMLIEGLRGQPVVIVSGLALGMDTIVHECALRVGLKCVAFPGSGLHHDTIYPRANLGLAKRIVDAGGALVSELKPDQKAALWTFPQRNRLMAGLAKATLIIEAEEESGTLITSRLATEYNRDVCAVPGSIFSPTTKGTHMLIRLGATPITCVKDLLEVLGLNPKTNDEDLESKMRDCSSEEIRVLELLREPMVRDDLIRTLEIPISEANSLLTVMEIKGLIKEELGEMRRS
jgi:DNA processing protein